MIKTTQPALHADQHLPDGSDPIPGLLVGATGTYDETVRALSDLVAYWPLGDDHPPPWADDGRMYDPPADLELSATGTVFGGADGGPANIDNGGVGISETGGGYLWFDNSDQRFDVGSPGADGGFTAACWVRLDASGSLVAKRGLIMGTSNDVVFGFGGWGFHAIYDEPGDYHAIRWTFGSSEGGGERYVEHEVQVGDWVFAVGTWDGIAAGQGHLYIDGNVVGSCATSGGGLLNIGIRFGRGLIDSAIAPPALDGMFAGVVDEAAFWARPLSGGEISALFDSADNTGVVPKPDGTWGKVTTTEIKDGTIIDQDISDTARISVSKLRPGSEGQVLTTESGLVVWDDPAGGSGGAAPTDTRAWLPLTTTNSSGDDVLVYDDDHSLIPTLTTF